MLQRNQQALQGPSQKGPDSQPAAPGAAPQPSAIRPSSKGTASITLPEKTRTPMQASAQRQ
jgi:hypothetical protein